MKPIKNKPDTGAPTSPTTPSGSVERTHPQSSREPKSGRGPISQPASAKRDEDQLQQARPQSTAQSLSEEDKIYIGVRAMLQKAPEKKKLTDRLKKSLTVSGKKRSTSSSGKHKDVPASISSHHLKTRIQEGGRSKGLKDFYVGGSMNVPETEGFVWLKRIIKEHEKKGEDLNFKVEKKEGQYTVRLARFTKELLESLSEDKHFKTLVNLISTRAIFPIYLSNHDGVQLQAASKSSSRAQVQVRNMTGEVEDKPESNVVDVRGSVALVLKFLCSKDEKTAAKIIAGAPDIILHDICTLPFHGNIFSGSALIEIVKAIIPPPRNESLSHIKMTRDAGALGECIRHYLRFPPMRDLKPAVSPSTGTIHADLVNQDLLAQNPGSFLREIAFLIDNIVVMAHEEPKERAAAMAKEAGWQAAFLMGHAFEYLREFAMILGQDQQHVVSQMRATASALQATSQGGPGFLEGLTTAETASQMRNHDVVELLAQNATSLPPSLDTSGLARDLALLSERMRILSVEGYLAPGKRKPTEADMGEFRQADSSVAKGYVEIGTLFEESYVEHLKEFLKGSPLA